MSNVDKNVLVRTDLMNRGFEMLSVGSEQGIVPRISTASGNRLSLGEDGLKVDDPTVRFFVLNPTANIRMSGNEDTRRILYLAGNFGVLHLDFKVVRTSGNTPIFTLPDGCPTPLHMIEHIVNGGQPLWWVPNERTIYCDSRVSRNQRIIIHTSGIFS